MAGETPRIQFATTEDGVRLAYTVVGEGEPLVCTPGWVSQQELEWQGPSGDFHRELARGRKLILFDGRGTGLSDRRVDEVSLETRQKDLEAVVRHLALERFALYGVSQWTPAAIVYAAQHPEQISKLVLYAPFCESFITSSGDERGALGRALIGLMRAEWSTGAKATADFIHPDADREEQAQTLSYLSASSSGEIAARILEEGMFETDVSQYVAQIECPTLVLHRREDNAVPLECGRRVASLLPDGRFVPLEGDHHLEFHGDAQSILREVADFLGDGAAAPAAERATEATAPAAPAERATPAAAPVEPTPAAAAAPPPTPSSLIARAFGSVPVTILFTDLVESTALTGRLGDEPAQELLRGHDAIVREALSTRGGREVKHTGDGIMASFPSASGALDGAINIQRAIARRNEEQPESAIHIRIGLNVGEPVREGSDLFGTAVQLARRICDRAEPDQILVSNVVRELVAGKGFLFADQGETALRGFEDPARLYEVRWTES